MQQAIHLSLDSNESDIISTAHNEQKSNVSIQATSEMEAGKMTYILCKHIKRLIYF